MIKNEYNLYKNLICKDLKNLKEDTVYKYIFSKYLDLMPNLKEFFNLFLILKLSTADVERGFS